MLCSILQHSWISQAYICRVASQPRGGFSLFIPGYNHGQEVILFLHSPESPQACNPALGGYIIQVRFISSMQVPCHCKYASRHLGANASWFSTHYIVNKTVLSQGDEPAFLYFSKVPSRCRHATRHLGATPLRSNFLKSQVTAGMQLGTWGLQYSAVEADYKVQIEDPAHHILMSRSLGATPAESFLKYKTVTSPRLM